MKKYKHALKEVRFNNRWTQRYPPSDWTIIGLARWWFGPTEYCYKLCLFGFDLQIWFEKI
jgi:hypothetical protein